MRFDWPMAKPAGYEDFFGRRRKLQLERKRRGGELSFDNRPTDTNGLNDRVARKTPESDPIVILDSPSPKRRYADRKEVEERDGNSSLNGKKKHPGISTSGEDWLMCSLRGSDKAPEVSLVPLPSDCLFELPNDKEDLIMEDKNSVPSLTEVCRHCHQMRPIVKRLDNKHQQVDPLLIKRILLPDIADLLSKSNYSAITSPCTHGETSEASQRQTCSIFTPQNKTEAAENVQRLADKQLMDEFCQLPASSTGNCLPAPDWQKLTAEPLRKWVTVSWGSDDENTSNSSELLSLLDSVCSNAEEKSVGKEHQSLPVYPYLEESSVQSGKMPTVSAPALDRKLPTSFDSEVDAGSLRKATKSLEKSFLRAHNLLPATSPQYTETMNCPSHQVDISPACVEKKRTFDNGSLDRIVPERVKRLAQRDRLAESKQSTDDLPYSALFRRGLKKARPTSVSTANQTRPSIGKRKKTSEKPVTGNPRETSSGSLGSISVVNRVPVLDSSQRGLLLDSRPDTTTLKLSHDESRNNISKQALFKSLTSTAHHCSSSLSPSGQPKQPVRSRSGVPSAPHSASTSSEVRVCFDLVVMDNDSDDELFVSAAEVAESKLMAKSPKTFQAGVVTSRSLDALSKPTDIFTSGHSTVDRPSSKPPWQLSTRASQIVTSSSCKFQSKPPPSVTTKFAKHELSSQSSGWKATGRSNATLSSDRTSHSFQMSKKAGNSALSSVHSARRVAQGRSVQEKMPWSAHSQQGSSASVYQTLRPSCPVCEMIFAAGVLPSEIDRHITICCGEDV